MQALTKLFRVLTTIENHWQGEIQTQVKEGLMKLSSLPQYEADTILSLLPGAEFKFLQPGDLAITDRGDKMNIIGYSETWINQSDIERELEE